MIDVLSIITEGWELVVVSTCVCVRCIVDMKLQTMLQYQTSVLTAVVANWSERSPCSLEVAGSATAYTTYAPRTHPRTHYPIFREHFVPEECQSFLGVKLPMLKWDSQIPTYFERIPNLHRNPVSFLRGMDFIYAPL